MGYWGILIGQDRKKEEESSTIVVFSDHFLAVLVEGKVQKHQKNALARVARQRRIRELNVPFIQTRKSNNLNRHVCIHACDFIMTLCRSSKGRSGGSNFIPHSKKIIPCCHRFSAS